MKIKSIKDPVEIDLFSSPSPRSSSLSSCVFEYNDPNDYFDISNHEVDRQDDLEYEVRTLLPYYHKLNVTIK